MLLHNAKDGRLEAGHPLSRLLNLIGEDKRFAPFNGLMQVMPGAARRIEYIDLASWLLVRARNTNAHQALADVETYLATHRMICRHVVAVGGIHPTGSHVLTDGVTLLPWDQLQDSRTKSVIEERFFLGGSDHPEAALTQDLEIPVLLVPHSEVSRYLQTLPRLGEGLGDLLLCLGLAGPTAPISLASWLEVPDWAPVMMSGYSFSLTEGYAFPRAFPTQAPQEGARLFAIWGTLPPARRTELHVPMVRLNTAMRRRNPVDAAIDLGIVLESIFLRDLPDDRGELTLRLRVRAGRWLGSSPQERKDIGALVRDLYGIRSKAVHRGLVPETTRGKPTTELLEEGYRLTARSLVNLIESAEPDWEDITFG